HSPAARKGSPKARQQRRMAGRPAAMARKRFARGQKVRQRFAKGSPKIGPYGSNTQKANVRMFFLCLFARHKKRKKERKKVSKGRNRKKGSHIRHAETVQIMPPAVP